MIGVVVPSRLLLVSFGLDPFVGYDLDRVDEVAKIDILVEICHHRIGYFCRFT